MANPVRRARTILLAALFIFTVFGAQLVRIQAFDASRTQQAALNKRLTSDAILALRGRILDSRGTVLAASVERRTITVNQQAVASYTRYQDRQRVQVGAAGAAARMAPLLGMSTEDLTTQLSGTATYKIIAKNVPPLVWRDIEAMGIPGIYSEQTFQREYPAGTTASSLVGYVGADNVGLGGLEYLLEEQLSGSPGKQVYERARDGTPIPWAEMESRPASDGSDVRLTINADLQWFAQNELARQVQATGSRSGTIVVVEAKTGKLRTVATYPTFDPSNLKAANSDSLGNRAFQDAFEPGSTGKVMSISAVLEEKLATPFTGVIVPNRLARSDRSFKDFKDHETLHLTLAGVLAKSSNIGTILAAEQVPPATLERYFRAFGVGEKSGIGFPGESTGLLTPADQWSGSQRYTTLFGQGYSLTAVQAAGVFQTIANKGVRLAPSLIESITAPDGNTVVPSAGAGTRVISEQTAATLGSMLEEVTQTGGTAPGAAIPGYRVAGKTGTANRYEERTGGYNGYTVSFIGFAPAGDPQYVVAVTLQKPALANPSGASLCGPLFKSVMTYVLQAYSVPPLTGAPVKEFPLTAPAPLMPTDPNVISDKKSKG